MSFDKIIDVYDRPPVKPSAHLLRTQTQQITSFALVEELNEALPAPRRVTQEVLDEIVSRESGNSAVAERALLNFISTIENPNTATPTHHIDLLPAGHPLAQGEQTPAATAEYFSSDPYITDDSVRTLVASAILSDPESVSRKFTVAQLSVRDPHGYSTHVIKQADASLGRL